MLIENRMSSPVTTVESDMRIMDALDLMKRNNIRRTPVVDKGKLVGIVSDKDLLNASASDATSLSVWELNYLIAKITVRQVMSKQVVTVTPDTPIEEAAHLMAANKIGGLPVTQGGKVVGLITETDLFKAFLDLMGAQRKGVRVTAHVPNRHGELAILTKAIAEAGGDFVSLGGFTGVKDNKFTVTFKVTGLDKAQVVERIERHVDEIVDVRVTE